VVVEVDMVVAAVLVDIKQVLDLVLPLELLIQLQLEVVALEVIGHCDQVVQQLMVLIPYLVQ
jgi:hypothetical protein